MIHNSPFDNSKSLTSGTHSRRSGFSLLELLISIAVIGILAAMLATSLVSAKSKARRTVCFNNLRQMGIAASIYTSDGDGSFPMAYWMEKQDGKWISYSWDLTLIPGPTPKAMAGVLWQGGPVSQVQQCPSYHGPANWVESPYTGYNYNTSYIGHGAWETQPDPAKSSHVLNPSQTLLFGDGEYRDGANKFMRSPWASPGDAGFTARWTGSQGFRHEGRSQALFVDGSAHAFQDRFVDNMSGSHWVTKNVGFLSEDNQLYDLE